MTTPDWLDTTAYPFDSHFVEVPDGRLHYVDEGSGETLLLLHGTPTWSFLYRTVIADLRADYRVVAPDQLGFGFSRAREGYSFRPEEQARNIAAFIDALDLRDITLVVHDYGGPVGLNYALAQPHKIKRLVILNTWLWDLRADWQKRLAGGFLGSRLGRWLCLNHNFEVNVIFPYAFADRRKLTPTVHAHYRQPAQDAQTRYAIWVYGRELLASGSWYASLWARHETLRTIPTLLLWGMKDPVFGPAYLARWQSALPAAQTVMLPDAGHYVQEEAGMALVPPLRAFLAG